MSSLAAVVRPIVRARGLVFGAILQKELRTSGRRRSTYIIRGGYAALFSVVTLMAVGSMLPSYEYESQTARAQMLTAFAESLVMFVAWFQFIMIALIAPAMTSSAICEEKQLGTLSALMTTPLTAMQIIVGKLAGRMYQVVVLTLISAPMLLAVRVFGGVPAETILAFTCVTLGTALFGGSMGLLFSMWHSRSAPAAMFALLTMGLVYLSPMILYTILMRTNMLGLGWLGVTAGHVNALAPIGYAACPPLALNRMSMEGLDRMGVSWLVGTPLDRIWVSATLLQLLGAGVVLLIGSRVLRRLLVTEAGGVAERPERTREVGRKGKPLRLRKLGERPIYWREVSRPWLESRFQLGVLVFVLVTAFGYAYWKTDLSEEPMHLILGLGGLGVIVLLASVQTTGAISGERDAQTWETLMTTPVSAWRVILDKYLASVVRLWPLALCVGAHFLYSAIMGHLTWQGAGMVMMLVVSPAMLYLATGLLLSMLLRKGAAASITNIALVLFVWVGLPVMAMLWYELNDRSYRSTGTFEAVLHATSPMGLIASIITDDVALSWRNRGNSFTLGDEPVSRGAMLGIVAGLGGAHLLLAAGTLAVARKFFARCSGRSS